MPRDAWKDEMARRLREREKRKNDVLRMIDKIDDTLSKLLNELKQEYSVKTIVKMNYDKNDEPFWSITIEDEKNDLTSMDLFRYLNEGKVLEDALINFLLDRFTFK